MAPVCALSVAWCGAMGAGGGALYRFIAAAGSFVRTSRQRSTQMASINIPYHRYIYRCFMRNPLPLPVLTLSSDDVACSTIHENTTYTSRAGLPETMYTDVISRGARMHCEHN